GLGLVKANALATLRRPKILGLAAALGSRLWSVAFAGQADAGLWRLRVPPGNLYPRLPRLSFLARLARGELGAVAEPKSEALVVSRGATARTAVFFPGCLVNYMLPEIGLATVKVLVAAGVRVVVPARPTCCGTPLYVNGDRTGATGLAEANLAWRSQSSLRASPVVFACPSCAESWRGYPELVGARAGAAAREAAGRVVDISVFMSEVAPEILRGTAHRDGPSEAGRSGGTVTYHDPCHLAQAQGVRSEPRALLRALPGVAFKEMADPGACCGSGGTFGLFQADLARRIGGRKAEDIATTGADTVATGCPACLLQLRQELHVAGQRRVAVRHTVELLAAALGDD
ncbi:MAG: (Fe-S)-binding protein, partial [Bacillota bacterium]